MAGRWYSGPGLGGGAWGSTTAGRWRLSEKKELGVSSLLFSSLSTFCLKCPVLSFMHIYIICLSTCHPSVHSFNYPYIQSSIHPSIRLPFSVFFRMYMYVQQLIEEVNPILCAVYPASLISLLSLPSSLLLLPPPCSSVQGWDSRPRHRLLWECGLQESVSGHIRQPTARCTCVCGVQ